MYKLSINMFLPINIERDDVNEVKRNILLFDIMIELNKIYNFYTFFKTLSRESKIPLDKLTSGQVKQMKTPPFQTEKTINGPFRNIYFIYITDTPYKAKFISNYFDFPVICKKDNRFIGYIPNIQEDPINQYDRISMSDETIELKIKEVGQIIHGYIDDIQKKINNNYEELHVINKNIQYINNFLDFYHINDDFSSIQYMDHHQIHRKINQIFQIDYDLALNF